MKRITLVLNDIEDKLMKDLETTLGYKPSFVLRQGFREFYDRVMPKKAKIPLIPGSNPPTEAIKTAEAWCIKQGGKLITNESGAKVCQIQEGGLTTELEIPEPFV